MFGLDALGGLIAGKPTIPQFTPVDAQVEQSKAIAGDQASLPAAQKLAGDTNAFNQDQLLQQLRKAIPNYDQLVSGAGSLISSMLSGVVPQDIQDQLQRSSAAKSLGRGYAGSGMHADLTARDLGMTSLQLTQTGLDSASRWISSQKQNATPGLFDVSSMFITPQQQIAVTTANNTGQFQRDYVANMNEWQHSTGAILGQSLINTDQQLSQLVISLAGSAGGMMKGGA